MILKDTANGMAKDICQKKDDSILRAAVKKGHQLNKPVRFWDAPDNTNAWNRMIALKADYLNTDHISALKKFLESR